MKKEGTKSERERIKRSERVRGKAMINFAKIQKKWLSTNAYDRQ